MLHEVATYSWSASSSAHVRWAELKEVGPLYTCLEWWNALIPGKCEPTLNSKIELQQRL